MATEEGWVGVEEMPAHLRVAQVSMYRWVESKDFPAHRVGRPFRFKLSEVGDWVQNRGAPDPNANSPSKGTRSTSAS